MSESVHVILSLRTPSGASIHDADEPITSANVDQYRASDEVVEAARKQLVDVGLRVVQTGAASITAAGSREQVEAVFSTSLQPDTKSVDTESGSASVSQYRAESPLTVPDAMQDVVAEAHLPEAPDFFP